MNDADLRAMSEVWAKLSAEEIGQVFGSLVGVIYGRMYSQDIKDGVKNPEKAVDKFFTELLAEAIKSVKDSGALLTIKQMVELADRKFQDKKKSEQEEDDELRKIYGSVH